MCDQLHESYKLERCVKCRDCNFNKNARSALFSLKPLSWQLFCSSNFYIDDWLSLGYNIIVNLTNDVVGEYLKFTPFCS